MRAAREVCIPIFVDENGVTMSQSKATSIYATDEIRKRKTRRKQADSLSLGYVRFPYGAHVKPQYPLGLL